MRVDSRTPPRRCPCLSSLSVRFTSFTTTSATVPQVVRRVYFTCSCLLVRFYYLFPHTFYEHSDRDANSKAMTPALVQPLRVAWGRLRKKYRTESKLLCSYFCISLHACIYVIISMYSAGMRAPTYHIVYKHKAAGPAAGSRAAAPHGATPTVVRGSVQPCWVRADSRTGHSGISGGV